MLKPDRVLLIVMDGCGAGSAPDADQFGDTGENAGNTLVNVAEAAGGLKIPTLRVLGLGNTLPLAGGEPHPRPIGSFGKLGEKSRGGKDTVTGHWEMMGILTKEPFPTYPQGFPPEVVKPFCEAIGSDILANIPASGTEIIRRFGEEHVTTGKPILYTSADSVFQIASHEEVIPIDRQYEMCRIARKLLTPPHGIQRVIARPFHGDSAQTYKRTERRKDFPLEAPENALDLLHQAGIRTAGIGVVGEVFDGRGFAFTKRTQTNEEHFQATLDALESDNEFIFVNFEDFDMLWGHRNDPYGFAKCLETFDGYLKTIIGRLDSRDLLLITADHGNDPTTPNTDHTREYVPALVYSPSLPGGADYGVRNTFADIGATVTHVFDVGPLPIGHSLI